MPFQSFLDLRSVFRDDARDAYEDLLDRRRGEHIRAFALLTDDDVMGASGAGDTAERLAKRLTTRQPRNLAEERYHEWEFGWQTGEWDNIYTNRL